MATRGGDEAERLNKDTRGDSPYIPSTVVPVSTLLSCHSTSFQTPTLRI